MGSPHMSHRPHMSHSPYMSHHVTNIDGTFESFGTIFQRHLRSLSFNVCLRFQMANCQSDISSRDFERPGKNSNRFPVEQKHPAQ